MKIKERLEDILADLRDEYLDDNNCYTQKEAVPYGDTEVYRDTGYSDEDWDRAIEYAEERIMLLIMQVFQEGKYK